MRSKKILISAAVGVLALALAAVAIASPQFSQTAAVKYTSKKPKSNSGLSVLLTTSDPGAPNKKPSPATKLVVTLAKGTVVNSSAAKQCTASDSDFSSKGASACPAGSRLGTGSAEATTGLGAPIDPVREDITAFAGKSQIILFLTPKGTVGQTAVIRGKIKKNVVTITVPAFPVPGAGNAALTLVNLKLKALSSGSGSKKKNLVTTPSTCPKSKKWAITLKFTYEDGTTKTVKATSPCK